ncbi:MAG: class I SAM-dependent RNA methyltransferase [Anaerolineales bacterium]|nr:class I SAM-dependent RNA methyltransferase [Anaerolineales bacterium]
MSDPTFEVTFEKLTYGGEALGRLPDQRAVFVPFGLPGERARIKLTEDKKNFARGEIVEILQPAAQRIVPRCVHFTRCGGCHYQHLAYADQLTAKTEILRDQLQRIGKIANPPIHAMVASPLAWNYRNHIQFHLTPEGRLGFVNAKENATLALTECHLPEAELDSLWKTLNFESNLTIERVSFRNGSDCLLILESTEPETPEIEIEADISVVHVYENHSVVIAGQDHTTLEILGQTFKVSASSFFQVNTKMAEKMVEHLIAQLTFGETPITLLDLYCGVGLFSKFFADKAQRIIGIEAAPSACEDFVANLDEFENVELYEGPAEEILPKLTDQISGTVYCIVDPPRAGIERHALDALVNIKPQIIAYVSCDPATLARDAARFMAAGYQLKQVTPFDLFPQTYHIEALAIFEI